MVRLIRKVNVRHASYTHAVAYDFYGKRLATCSSDQQIKVWDEDERGEWRCTAVIKAHKGSVLSVAWAHPEFGQVIASCSADTSIQIWEEQVEAGTNRRTWRPRARLTDPREEVHAVEFAPRHLGLKLASCSKDGVVRIYEAVDVMDLSGWPLTESFEAGEKDCTCLSWNTSPFDPPLLVVGSQKSARVWEYDESFRRWHEVAKLDGHAEAVHDVAWAPAMGRSFHIIATACNDGKVRVFQLRMARDGGRYEVKCVAELPQHKAAVWRVRWNITGTVLASTGDDGAVRLWKADLRGTYRCTAVVKSGGGEEDDEDAEDGVVARANDGGGQQKYDSGAGEDDFYSRRRGANSDEQKRQAGGAGAGMMLVQSKGAGSGGGGGGGGGGAAGGIAAAGAPSRQKRGSFVAAADERKF